MRITPTLTLCAALAAGNPALAQPVLRDIGAMLSGAKSGSAIVRSDRGLLLETRHCIDGQAPVAAQLRGQLGVAHEAALLDLFQRILCARSDDSMGKLSIARYGEDAADSFGTGMTFYSGSKELGEWPIEIESHSPRDEAYISMLGLTPNSPISGVSLWQTPSPGRVRVWFAPFLHRPSDAMTYDFELRGERWVWVAAVSSSRILG